MWFCLLSAPPSQSHAILLTLQVRCISRVDFSTFYTVKFCRKRECKRETLCGWDSPKLILSSKPIINVVAQVGLCMRLRTERDFLAEQIVENALSDSDNEGKVSCHVVLRCGFCNNPSTKQTSKSTYSAGFPKMTSPIIIICQLAQLLLV